jgi:hypothetical protein
MKRLALCLGMLFSLAFSLVSLGYAAPHSGTGAVYILRSYDSALGPNIDWFSLVGVSSLGTCNTADGGYVVLRIRDDAKGQRMFTLILAAKASNTPLTVWVDDTVTDSSGHCYVLAVE